MSSEVKDSHVLITMRLYSQVLRIKDIMIDDILLTEVGPLLFRLPLRVGLTIKGSLPGDCGGLVASTKVFFCCQGLKHDEDDIKGYQAD